MGESYGGHSGKAEDEGTNKEKKVLKILIKWEDELYDFFSLVRVEKVDKYSPEAIEGMVYGIKMRFMGFPSEKDFFYGSEKLRDDKLRLLENKLRNSKVIIV